MISMNGWKDGCLDEMGRGMEWKNEWIENAPENY